MEIPRGNLSKINIEGFFLEESNLIAVNFSNSTLTNNTFNNCRFCSAQFINATINKNNIFHGSNFTRTKFINCRLKGLNLSHCIINGAVFKNSELQSAIFNGVDCSGVSFKDCNLRSANFVGAKNISREMILEAKNHEYIKLPEGINLQK